MVVEEEVLVAAMMVVMVVVMMVVMMVVMVVMVVRVVRVVRMAINMEKLWFGSENKLYKLDGSPRC